MKDRQVESRQTDWFRDIDGQMQTDRHIHKNMQTYALKNTKEKTVRNTYRKGKCETFKRKKFNVMKITDD